MEHMMITSHEKNGHQTQPIKLSIFDALKLCHTDIEDKIIFTESSPILSAYIRESVIEFITDDGQRIIYDKNIVKEAVNKHYFIGQKSKPKH